MPCIWRAGRMECSSPDVNNSKRWTIRVWHEHYLSISNLVHFHDDPRKYTIQYMYTSLCHFPGNNKNWWQSLALQTLEYEHLHINFFTYNHNTICHFSCLWVFQSLTFLFYFTLFLVFTTTCTHIILKDRLHNIIKLVMK